MESHATDAGELTLRPCVPEDKTFLFALFASVRAGDFAALNWPMEQLEPLLRMQFAAQSQSYAAAFPRARHEIIRLRETPVGHMITDDSADAVHLVDIALMAGNRGGGLGASVLRGLQARCASLHKPLRLHVAADNRARRLYERLGFSVIGGTEVHLLMEWTPAE